MAKNGIVRSMNVNSTTASVVLGASVDRVAIVFFPGLLNTYTVTTDPGLVPGMNGVTMSVTASPLLLTLDEVGDVVQKPWYGIAVAGTSTIGLIETIKS